MVSKKKIKTAIFCDRPIHVFNALNYVYHNLNDSLGNTDLFIIADFKNAREIASRVSKEKIFTHVFLLSRQQEVQLTSRVRHELNNIKRFLHLQDPIHIFLQEELSKFVITPTAKNIILDYDVVCTSAWGTSVWWELVNALREKNRLFFIDDGFLSYRKSNIMELEATTLEQRIRKLFRWGKYGVQVDRLYLNNPQMCRFVSKKIFTLPPMDTADLQFRQIEERVFGKVEELSPVIFLGQMLLEQINVNLQVLYQDIFHIVIDNVGKDKFSIRLHPSQKPEEVLGREQIRCEYGQTLWEINCREALNDGNILIGFSSTALVTPKMFFDKEPVVICLYRLLAWKDQQLLRDTDEFFNAVREQYRDKKRFYIVDTIQQFREILQSTELP